MTNAQVNPNPKARFQEVEANIKGHHAVLENPTFNLAQDMALLEYNRKIALELGASQNPQVQGMINAWKLAGVQEFISEFRNLAEKVIPAQPPGLARTLDHKN